MRLSTLLGPDLKVMLETAPEELHGALEEFHPEDISEIVVDLDLALATQLIQALPDEFGADVFERLPPDRQEEIFGRLTLPEAAELLSEMDPDDRLDALQDIDEDLASSLITHLERFEPEAAEEVRELGRYDEDVAGGLMTPDFVALPPDTKAWKAIDEIRRISREGDAETVAYVYIVYGEKLVGVLSLRDLILADPSALLEEIMFENVVAVRDTDDQEVVAQTIAKYDLAAVPVTDDHGRLVGVVTVDDVVDVVIEEATEDAHLMGAVTPVEESYLDTPLGVMFRSRVIWLIVLFVGGLVTATVMERYEVTLQAVIALAVFVPLIISSGGNAGSQSASLVIRALAVQDVKPEDWLRVLRRETVTAVSLGLVLAALGFARVYLLGGGPDPIPMALTVSLSILAVVLVGSLVGSLLPIFIQRVGLDPAVSSTPFIASLVDVVGLIIYLSMARWILGLA